MEPREVRPERPASGAARPAAARAPAERLSLIGAGIVYASFLLFIAVTYGDYGLSWDEPYYLHTGRLFVSNFWDMAPITRDISEAHLRSHGLVVDGLYYLALSWLSASENIDVLHLIKALASSILLILIYRILVTLGKDSTGNGGGRSHTSRLAGIAPLIGVLLIVFYPPWLGHAFDNHMDGHIVTDI